MLFEKRGDGGWQAQNGLGVTVAALLYCDPAGKWFAVEGLRNGETKQLSASTNSVTKLTELAESQPVPI